MNRRTGRSDSVDDEYPLLRPGRHPAKNVSSRYWATCGIIDFPVLKLTSVMFGGPDLDTLYVTSMAKPSMPRFPGDGQLRGSLFAIRGLGVHGIPEPRFGA